MTETSRYQPAVPLSETEARRFAREGFVIVRGLSDTTLREQLANIVRRSLTPPLAPLEFESDVAYPGSPPDRLAPGGDTPRRLLHACARDEAFRQWAAAPAVTGIVKQLLHAERIKLSQNHHNCVMTKHPGYSSSTLWHQDIRYWTFDRPELVTVWLALGEEHPANGGVHLLPGTHRAELDRGRFDASLFLRPDLAENRELIDTATAAVLSPGDVLFFHCRAFHAAGANTTNDVKLSLVFTYYEANNHPIAGTRSAKYPDIEVG